ncbi:MULTISPECIES: nitronate monooxygenase [unclassified Paenibacillus]|uniref:NAD(P)H-dependent flavin oxidoreductase n=1 Tax=unclassified Paenibacillus TaxID=185978 RepID=UPI00020D69D5|nr:MULTISPECIES: nitronate monooxygenase [unclassified Paenibacillus]EGL18355.1 oxidoreductase, 2-nitropropane dioxygenase family protein [Paenibacillus sp. HGF7]EPD80616.1 hypothetical protein HMPREF1207_04372 [Paenibacillus sp. HGH0039]
MNPSNRSNRICTLFQIRYPLIQAGMAGGSTTPALVAAVSEAGGLGTLGAGYMTPEQISAAVREIRSRTGRPFAVNLFILPEPGQGPHEQEQRQKADEAWRLLAPLREKTGTREERPPAVWSESYREQLAVLLEERVPVFSSTFDVPDAATLAECARLGIRTIGTATTVREAAALEEAGVDAIVAQGSEAGGHRGTFPRENDGEPPLIGTMALVPQIADRVRVPVIAAGGIMDGRGIAAALALGADAVQLGTAFLACVESGAHAVHKEAVLSASDESTVLTRAVSGKHARGIRTALLDELQPLESRLPSYPAQNTLTQGIRRSAAKAGNPAYMAMWAGQAASLAQHNGAAQIIEELVRETGEVLNRISGRKL